jgi:hypothetical protein
VDGVLGRPQRPQDRYVCVAHGLRDLVPWNAQDVLATPSIGLVGPSTLDTKDLMTSQRLAPTTPQDFLATSTGVWSEGMQRMFGWTRASATPVALDPSLIDRYFDSLGRFTERWVELNRRYVHGLASAVMSAQGAMRQHAESLSDAVNEELEATSTTVQQHADQVTQAQRDQIEAAEREDRARTRRSHRVAREAAAEKFRQMTKPELQDELTKRSLPRAGTVGELRGRLVEAELETATA